mmetsp:Transcript_11561/g.19198  ORF Transcript_11561/g.19198 Transcript_11561/m.19198 type:complete len:213 (+) Transcript_11561:42-680(+)
MISLNKEHRNRDEDITYFESREMSDFYIQLNFSFGPCNHSAFPTHTYAQCIWFGWDHFFYIVVHWALISTDGRITHKKEVCIKRSMYNLIFPPLLRRMHVVVASAVRRRRGSVQSAHTGYGGKWRPANLDGTAHVARVGTPPLAAPSKMNENFLLATLGAVDRLTGWIFVPDQPVPNRCVDRSQSLTYFGSGHVVGRKIPHGPAENVIGQYQ